MYLSKVNVLSHALVTEESFNGSSIMSFAQNMIDRAKEIGSRVIVGLDPDISNMPRDLQKIASTRPGGLTIALQTYLMNVIDATQDHAVAFKPNTAFFEQYQSIGLSVLEEILNYLRFKKQIVILDAKRGDIGHTAAAYGRAWLSDKHSINGSNPWKADAITVQPYTGEDGIIPFLEAREGAGVFVLCRTSNPSADTLQKIEDAHGEHLYIRLAREAFGIGKSYPPNNMSYSTYSDLGLVVASTKSIDDVIKIRHINPRALFLMPGIGAQGGSLDTLIAGGGTDTFGAYAAASRSILYPKRRTKEEDSIWDSENWPIFVKQRCAEEVIKLKTAIQDRQTVEKWRMGLKGGEGKYVEYAGKPYLLEKLVFEKTYLQYSSHQITKPYAYLTRLDEKSVYSVQPPLSDVYPLDTKVED